MVSREDHLEYRLASDMVPDALNKALKRIVSGALSYFQDCRPGESAVKIDQGRALAGTL